MPSNLANSAISVTFRAIRATLDRASANFGGVLVDRVSAFIFLADVVVEMQGVLAGGRGPKRSKRGQKGESCVFIGHGRLP